MNSFSAQARWKGFCSALVGARPLWSCIAIAALTVSWQGCGGHEDSRTVAEESLASVRVVPSVDPSLLERYARRVRRGGFGCSTGNPTPVGPRVGDSLRP